MDDEGAVRLALGGAFGVEVVVGAPEVQAEPEPEPLVVERLDATDRAVHGNLLVAVEEGPDHPAQERMAVVEVVGGELEGAFHRAVQIGAARLVDIGGEGAGDALDAHAHPRQAGLEGHAEGAALGVDQPLSHGRSV